MKIKAPYQIEKASGTTGYRALCVWRGSKLLRIGSIKVDPYANGYKPRKAAK